MPVILDVELGEDDLLLMMAHDSDPFNRWQAAQSFATRLMIRSTQLIRAGELPEFNPDFAEALGATIEAGGADPAFAARLVFCLTASGRNCLWTSSVAPSGPPPTSHLQ